MVLYRCTSEHHPVAALELHSHGRGLRSAVLHYVSLVKADGGPLLARDKVLDAQQQSVGGNHHVALAGILYHLLPVGSEVKHRDIK